MVVGAGIVVAAARGQHGPGPDEHEDGVRRWLWVCIVIWRASDTWLALGNVSGCRAIDNAAGAEGAF